MNKTDKIKEGMTLIEVKEHYRPFEKPMVKETSKKVRKIITELYQKKHIDEMTFKWLSQTPTTTQNLNWDKIFQDSVEVQHNKRKDDILESKKCNFSKTQWVGFLNCC